MFKRFFDLWVTLILMVLLAPFFIFLCVMVLLGRKNQLIFSQVRIGKDDKPFTLYKLKTMNDQVDDTGKKLPDAQRLTHWGRILRKTSLDELPQLWNILTGEMSLVGPRPLLPQYLPLYSERQKRRHEVKPGITGWAQINGRNSISWQEKFELDLYYVENQSFKLDLQILILTFVKVLKSKDINAKDSTTMKPFLGNETDECSLKQ